MWRRALSVSYSKVGEVQEAQGDLAAALKSYRDSLALREALAASDPGNAGRRRDLALIYFNVGDIQKAQGDLAAALNPTATASPSPRRCRPPIPTMRCGGTICRLATTRLGTFRWRKAISPQH